MYARLERALPPAILFALLVGFRRRNPAVVVNGILSLGFAMAPRALEAIYELESRPWQRTWVGVAGMIHVVGMLGSYDRIWWWDHLAHTVSAGVVAGVADVAIRRTPDGSSRHRSRDILAVTLTLGILWEILEYVVHVGADRLGHEPLLVHYGRLDALGDLVFDLVGAAIVIRYGESALANVVGAAHT